MQNPTVCLCAAADQSEIAVKVEAGSKCGAVESVGGKRVGCTNSVSSKAGSRRVLKGSKPMMLCQDHADRMRGHNVCPFCSEFCAHVSFPYTKSC